MNIRSVKGMNDISSPEIFAWRYAEKIIREHFENFGLNEIKTPIVEMTSLFSRTVGDTTDIVQKEMYTFNDRNNESLTLRPEGTASVVRALVEHGLMNLDPVQKLFYWGPMYRYERPQKGRYRQFYQYGVEIFGVGEARQDAEVIALLYQLYEKFQLQNLKVQVSSLGCDDCRPVYRAKLVELIKPSMHILCADCQTRFEKNPLRILDCKNPTCKEVASVLPSMLDFLCQPCTTHFNKVRDDLVMLKVPFVVDPRLVRGLDYYNRTVFEITTTELGAQNTIGAGGRYDKLVKQLGGPETPAIGFAGGVERLILLLTNNLDVDKMKKWEPKLKLFCVLPDEKGADLAFKTAFALREHGITCEIDYTMKSMKSQMKRADKLAAHFVLILGGSEMDAGHGVLRNMQTKEQENIDLKNLESELLRRLK